MRECMEARGVGTTNDRSRFLETVLGVATDAARPWVALLVAACASLASTAHAQCPWGALHSDKDNKLYLYFPTTSDSSFPEYNPDVTTSPLAAFDVADLDAGIGTTADLRDAIFDIVQEDYCEFNVEVVQVTAAPSPAEARWQIVGIGSDSETVFGGDLFGVAQDVDLNDSDAQDYARVYAASFLNAYGGSGGVLEGSNSTLDRWARAIGHTTSHEAGHNYGLGHGNSAAKTGEDAQNNHVLATGSTGLTGEARASRVRHFSDTSYEILGHNIGLNIKTLHNWDFTNPNSTDAHSLELTILSTASSLTLDWHYTGSLSPWTNPTITSTGGTQSFQGTTYNEFTLEFSDSTSWSGGSDGVAPPGVKFHVGATFNESDPVIVYETTLKDSGGGAMTLHPRMIGYDAGTADLSSGDFAVAFFNPNPDEGDFEVRDVRIRFLPRLLDINAMVEGAELTDIRGLPVAARPPAKDRGRVSARKLGREPFGFSIANLADPRHVDIEYDATGCEPGIAPMDGEGIEVVYCPDGTALSLFPSTYVYVTATIVDPSATYFDRASGTMVTGPLESKLFYQFVGIVPDFNENGVDDLLDIRDGTSQDDNGNGVPDEAEEDRPAAFPLWLILVIALLLVLILLFVLLRRR